MHAKHASDHGYTYVVVVSEDTDVYVLCIVFEKDIKGSFYQKRGTKTRTRYLDIKQVRTVLGDRLSQALLGCHAFTGCDSVSAFSGRGKTGPLKQLRKDTQVMDTHQPRQVVGCYTAGERYTAGVRRRKQPK